MAESFGGDLNLESQLLQIVFQGESFALGHLAAGTPDRLHQLFVPENLDRFLERFKIVWGKHYGSRPAISCDDDALVLTRHTVYQLG